MNKIALATVAGALALLATPASAGSHGHSYGHGHGHSSYAHVQHHSHHNSYASHQPTYSDGHHNSHSYHTPTYSHGHVYQPSYHQPSYVAHYAKPVYVEPTTTYVKRPAYVYQKVSGYCTDVVKTYGDHEHRKTVECKAGEYQKPEVKHVEPAPAPEPEAPVEQK